MGRTVIQVKLIRLTRSVSKLLLLTPKYYLYNTRYRLDILSKYYILLMAGNVYGIYACSVGLIVEFIEVFYLCRLQ